MRKEGDLLIAKEEKSTGLLDVSLDFTSGQQGDSAPGFCRSVLVALMGLGHKERESGHYKPVCGIALQSTARSAPAYGLSPKYTSERPALAGAPSLSRRHLRSAGDGRDRALPVVVSQSVKINGSTKSVKSSVRAVEDRNELEEVLARWKLSTMSAKCIGKFCFQICFVSPRP